MNLKLKILLLTSNHITGKLISLKLNSFGHEVSIINKHESVLYQARNECFDLLVLDRPTSQDVIEELTLCKLPTIIIDSSKKHTYSKNSNTMNLTFTEEEFLHKVTFVSEFNSDVKETKSLVESVICHYSGDKDLAEKVIKSFLEGWESSIDDIAVSFIDDDDKILGRKVHSFKGVLSALGETEASLLIRKMEILIKGRSRESARVMFSDLRKMCETFSSELEVSVFSL